MLYTRVLLQIMLENTSVTSKKSPNVYKSCPKMISQEKDIDTVTKIA